MSRFSEVLSEVDGRLMVQEPARSRILLELAADMEDLHGEYLARGFSEEDAHAAVMDHFDLSEEVLRELVKVHDTPFQRSLENLSGHARSKGSRLLMIVLAVLVTGGSGTLLFRGQLYRDASGLVWILMPILAVGLAMAMGQARRIYKAVRDWDPSLGSGLGRLLGLATLMIVVAASGLWLELYLGALRIREAPGEALIHLAGWLHMASATLVIALSGALALGFLWFLLQSRVRRRELAAVTELLEGIR